MDTKIKFLEWKDIEVRCIKMQVNDGHIDVNMKVNYENIDYDILFENTSRIKINIGGFPIKMFGFEIIDNKQSGWDSDSRYTIIDYEDNILKFVCEDISLISIDE